MTTTVFEQALTDAQSHELRRQQTRFSFYERIASRAMRTRGLTNEIIADWQHGLIDADRALLMVQAALAAGPVKTRAQVEQEVPR